MTASRNLDLVERINDYLVELPPALHLLVNIERSWRERHPTVNDFVWFCVGVVAAFAFFAGF